MGNVMAAGQAPANTSMPPPPPPTVGFPQSFAKTEPGPGGPNTPRAAPTTSPPLPPPPPQPPIEPVEPPKLGLENPGPMDELHKKCRDVFPTVFEGAKLMVSKALSNHFQVSHTVNMSAVNPSGYRFGATYVGTKQISPTEAFPVFLGDIDPSGNLNANVLHQFGQRIRVKFGAQVQNSKFNVAQLTTDYRGDDYTVSFTLANPDIINESGVFVTHYLQQVSQRVALGAELAYQYGPQVPGGEVALMTAAARYTGIDNTVSGTVGASGVHLCYYQKASEQLSLGCELETNFRLQESVASLGYCIDLPKADLVFKGMVDSNGTVGGVLEKKLMPLPFTFALSGAMNHSKNQFRLGCGLIIG